MDVNNDLISDAVDSPSRNSDPHGKAKRPDKQLYVPRQKREEPSESDSPSRNNGDENVNSGQQKPSKPKNSYKRHDDDYSQSQQQQQRGRDTAGNRKQRDFQGNNGSDYHQQSQSSTAPPKVNRKTTGANAAASAEGGDYNSSSADKQPRPKRPVTSSGSQNSSSSRTFHNSSGGGSGGAGVGTNSNNNTNSNSNRRPATAQHSSEGKPKSSQHRSGERSHSGWNGDGGGDSYYEDYGDYYGEYGNYGKSYGNYGSSRYGNNNDGYNSDRQDSRRSRQTGNRNPQRSNTELSLSEQTKAAEAIAAQLPDLLAPMPPPLTSSSSRSQTDSRSNQQQQQTRNKNQQQPRRDNQQSTYSSDKSHFGKGRPGGYGRSNDYGDSTENSQQQRRGVVHDNERQQQHYTEQEEEAHGHRGGLLFVNQASLHQQQGGHVDEHHRQQLSPFSHNQPPQGDDSHSRAQLLISEIDQAEACVLNLFNTSGLNVEYITQALNRLRIMYSNSILTDATYALEHNRDQAMWNGVFYKLYSTLRYNLVEKRQTRFAPSIVTLVDETVGFYDDICTKLADKYNVNRESSIADVKKAGEKKSTKCARLLLQRLYISLGDLFRYRCSAIASNADADIAQKHYEAAQRLAPKNSHPFNQMAVLALMTKRRFDAVYYFCRALAASNPILSVSENLMAIFNDACRRAEDVQAFDEESERNRRQSLTSIDSRRSEIWFTSEGRRTVMSGAQSSELDDTRYSAIVQRLPLAHLANRLVDSILNVHGRIFSKVGLDSMPDAVSRCLWELEVALTVDLPLLTPTRLAHLTLLNFFAVWRCSTESSTKSSGSKSLAEIFAVEFVLDCAALIIRHARSLYSENKHDSLRRIMPCVKLYADWLLYNRTVWHPPPCALDPTMCPEDLDLFAQIASFVNATTNYDVSVASETDPRMQSAGNAALLPVQLEEDDLVAGFAPFAKIRLVTYEMAPGTEPASASFAARLQRFRTLADFLCGIEHPVLEFNVDSGAYSSLVSSVCRSEKQLSRSGAPQAMNVPPGALPPPLFDFAPQQRNNSRSGQNQIGLAGESELDEMRRRRRDLAAEADRKRADEEYRRALLMREEQQGVAAGNVVMEVRPLVLVIDTNSIIDFMPAIRRIVESNKFTIVLPVVVISELNSLSMGHRGGPKLGFIAGIDDDHEDDHLSSAAREALSFFELQFNRRNNRIKAMTSDGNILATIAFRDQLFDPSVSNDDAILGCAIHYCKMNEALDRNALTTAAAGGSGTIIKREVVLVTCDRNLRIKAHLSRVPTCPMLTLLKWAQISATGSHH